VVCNINPDCCIFDWDANCAVLARTECCGEPGCGSGCNEPCLLPHAAPFCDDPYCCAAVCQARPSCCEAGWDDNCVGIAVLRCGSACGVGPAGDCFTVHDLPGCDQGQCCARVCQTDPYCCQAGWDAVCVGIAAANPSLCVRIECGDFVAGSPCFAHPNPASNEQSCCEAVCFGPLSGPFAPDPYCCNTEWDLNCVDIARSVPDCGCGFSCGDPCAGDCCQPHDNPSCNDLVCCTAVCDIDPYCCDVVWDAVCAQVARDTCNSPGNPQTGTPPGPCSVGACGDSPQSCCFAGLLPFCADQVCCEAICLVQPFCCDVSWDDLCATLARDECSNCPTGSCGSPTAGSCFQVQTTPYCSDLECCVIVCEFSPICCEVEWDAECVKAAEFACVNFKPRPSPPSPTGIGGRPHLPPPGWIPARERYERRNVTPLKPSPKQPGRRPEEAEPTARQPGTGGLDVSSGVTAPVPSSALPSKGVPAKGGKASGSPAAGGAG
jgi:hypothetical protein